METEARAAPQSAEEERQERPPLRDEMRPARGLLVGIALSSIFWLGLLVLWLAL
ncbi:hypothetical protein [Aureimonas sp. SK2]|uniref:hypothetical protein n=1 Tax=Aureimonas sp. SK2 TaxID=3015992 RepID=UPI00244444A7|nr:hypothetical protein [Aureimonas sp. SK2]